MFERDSNNVIAVLSALPQELSAINTLFGDVCKNDANGFVHGAIAGVNIVAGLSGMGKVNAAATTQRLVSQYGVRALIFTGVAGGLSHSFNIGDIVWGDSTFQHDYGFLGEKLTTRYPGTLPELGLGHEDQELTFKLGFKDQSINAQLYKTLQAVRLGDVNIDGNKYQPMLRRGVIATGDQFIANENKKSELVKIFNADAVEMEGAAVAQVCHSNQIPCFLLRAISDNASAHAPKDFPKFMNAVAQNNALLVHSLLTHPLATSLFSSRGAHHEYE